MLSNANRPMFVAGVKKLVFLDKKSFKVLRFWGFECVDGCFKF